MSRLLLTVTSRVTSRKTLLRTVIALIIVVFASIILITNMQSFIIFTPKSRDNSSLPQCVNGVEVLRSIRERFEKSGRTLHHRQSLLDHPKPDRSFSNKNIVKTLTQIASMIQVEQVNCLAIFTGSKHETDRAIAIAQQIESPICDQTYIDLTTDCPVFQAYRGYIMSPLTKEEENFPLAFSFVAYKDVEMIERLLRAIYRPQNYYCIHVDQKSSDSFSRAVTDITNCFPNVIIASRRINVQWGKFSVLEPELLCMEDLWRFPNWKYFFTLTGQEFPLKNNLELVRILTAYNGANDVMSTIKLAQEERWKKVLPPHGVRPVKGSIHVVVNRDFVDYALHNETAQDVLDWTKITDIPDETFFPVLNANPQLGIRGTYKGDPEMTSTRPFMARYKNWEPAFCAGFYIRNICILSTGDLPSLLQAKQLFANKFYLNNDRVVIGCLEERIFNDTRDYYIGTKNFSASYYSDLDFVKNQVH